MTHHFKFDNHYVLEKIKMSILFFAITLNILMTNAILAINCPVGYYYNVRQEQCLQCSLCNAINQVMKKQCTTTKDAMCGPFDDWQPLRRNHNSLPKLVPKLKTNSANVNSESQTASRHVTDSPPELFSNEVNYWKTLSLALIGLLVIISILITVYCIVAYIRRKRKKMIRETEREIDEIYLRARLFSRDRLSTTEYQHTLQDLEETVPTKKRRLKRIYRPRGHCGRGEVVDEVFVERRDNEKCYSFSKVNKFRLGAIPEINEKLELEKVQLRMRELSSGDEQCSDIDRETVVSVSSKDTGNAILTQENEVNDLIECHGDSPLTKTVEQATLEESQFGYVTSSGT